MSKQFAEFRVTDIFEIENGVRLKSDDHIPGNTPYISAREGNNGISNWVANSNSSLDSDLLGVNYNGNVLEAYYHPYEAIFSDDVKRFKIKKEKPTYRMYMYVATAIKKLKKAYSYTKKFNSSEISKVTITLPVNDESAGTDSPEPDWEYMEEYIKGIEEKYLDDVVTYNKRNGDILDTLYPDYNGSSPEAYDYAEFRVGDLFTQIKKTSKGRGFAKSQIETDEFSLPGLSATNTNNGFGFYLNPNEHDALVDCITVSANGVNTGYTAYQSLPFGIAQDAYALRLKNTGNTRRQHLYCVAALNKNNALKYDYTTKAGWTRLKEDTITLPVTDESANTESPEPDWEYMENYIKGIEKQERENRSLREEQEEHILKQLATKDISLPSQNHDQHQHH